MPIVDLHTHTVFSDGAHTPQQLIELLLRKGVEYAAITDHDNVNAWKPENLKFPAEVNPTKDITNVVEGSDILKIRNPYAEKEQFLYLFRGVEITSMFEGHPLHIIGLGIRFPDQDYLRWTDTLRILREGRIITMSAEINFRGTTDSEVYRGLSVDTEAFKEMLRDCHPSRLHLGKYLADKQYAKTPREAMDRYLNRTLRSYSVGFDDELDTAKIAIERIHQLGGVAILPHLDRLASDSLERTIDILKADGLDGIEIQIAKGNELVQKKEYIALASTRELLMSAGTDNHGEMEYKKDGDYTGVRNFSQHYIEEIAAKLSQYRGQSIIL